MTTELRPPHALRDLESGLEKLALEQDVDPAEVWTLIGLGTYEPFIVVRDGEERGFAILEFRQVPPCMYIVALYDGRELFSQEGMEMTQNLARERGCVDDGGQPMIRFQSQREGWKRVAPRFGFKPVSTNYRFEGVASGRAS